MPIQVFVADEQDARPVESDRLAQLARAVLADRGLGVDSRAELNVLLVDEETIAEMNERFLGHTGPTDVLSFPIEDEVLGAPPPPGLPRGAPGPGRPPAGGAGLGAGPGAGPRDDDGALLAPRDEMPLLVGDVVICPEVAFRNAPDHAGSYDGELALLLVHGILHLLGMDHEGDHDAEEMEALERELLARYHAPRAAS